MLEIKEINRINLLVGRNNAGKSNILEAVFLYATHFNLNSIMQVNDQRSERVISPHLIERGAFSTLCLPLVHNRSIETFCREGVELKSNMQSIILQQVKVISIEREDEIIRNYRAFRPDEVIEHGVPRVGIPSESGVRYFKLTYEPTLEAPCIYVNCTTKRMLKWTEYWDNIVLTDAKNSIIKALQIIDPNIEDVAVVSLGSNNLPKPYVKLNGEVLPLFAMGDGIVHIFNIMLALVNAKNGTLLLDEMENGLHVRTLEQLWTIVNDLSKDLDVQVFVTTHSNDCIRAFKENAREAGRLFRINYQNGETMYKSHGFRTIEASLSANIDLRDYTNDEVSSDED